MRIRHAAGEAARPALEIVQRACVLVQAQSLEQSVRMLSFPRHAVAEAEGNARAADMLAARLAGPGRRVFRQGIHGNVVAWPETATRSEAGPVLVGAHLDTVPGTPGADDNASGLAALIACAEATAQLAPDAPIAFVAFNREEDGLLGSTDFVRSWLLEGGMRVRVAHVLEMIGFCRHEPETQFIPPRLPVRIPRIGNFLGVIGNRISKTEVRRLLERSRVYTPELPVVGLEVWLGLERHFKVLRRSDHAPFWQARMPALMWTDTSEFRNPNYHRPTDTPETLDYGYLARVTRLVVASALEAALAEKPGASRK